MQRVGLVRLGQERELGSDVLLILNLHSMKLQKKIIPPKNHKVKMQHFTTIGKVNGNIVML